ncbi:MAG: ImmA/IrrE family metallo-endopeptidase [Bacteriovoracia bacterium]
MSKKQAIRLAEDTLEKYQPKDDLETDIDCIAQKLNIEVKRVDLESHISGSIVFGPEKTVILINQNHSETRQRFSLAHELGHFLLHNKENPFFVDSVQIEWRRENFQYNDFTQEVEANVFAASILMPEKRIYKYIRNNDLFWFNETDIKTLAKTFNVSLTAMRIRLVSMGIIDPVGDDSL